MKCKVSRAKKAFKLNKDKKDFLRVVYLLENNEISGKNARRLLNLTISKWRSVLTDATFFFKIYEYNTENKYETIFGMLPDTVDEKVLRLGLGGYLKDQTFFKELQSLRKVTQRNIKQREVVKNENLQNC